MTNLYMYPEMHEPNSSAVLAVFRVLRRQPWDQWAGQAFDVLKRLLTLALVAVSLAALMPPAAAQARTYDVLSADVPFKFSVGDRTFGPGHYQFIFAGPGMMVLRDAHQHVVASLVTKWVETGNTAPETKLVFDTQAKRARLTQICIQSRSQALEIVGEELAMHSSPVIVMPANSFFSFSQRPEGGFRLKY